jgi:hypothetical protein
MDSVEQTFAMRGRRIHDVAGAADLPRPPLEVLDLASALGQPNDGEAGGGRDRVGGGRRHAFGVQERSASWR